MAVPVAFALLGCGSAPLAEGNIEQTGSAESALYGGVLDNDKNAVDAVVALRIGDGSPFDLCTGTLIAPNVVLTARHCVSRNTTDEIDCREDGVSNNGAQVGADVSPRTVRVLLGPKPDFNSKPAALGKTIFRPTGDIICNTDIAIVVLDRPVVGARPAAVRLSAGVRVGETMRAVGYGQNDQSARLGTRFRKEGIKIKSVGPLARDGKTGRPAIAGSEFEVGKSICQGDSGGPALSEETGAVIGVVSRGVDCGLDFGHIYTRTAGFRTLFETAFAEAGGAPVEELETAPAEEETFGASPRVARDGTGSNDSNQAQSLEATRAGCTVGAMPTRESRWGWSTFAVGLLGFAARRRRT